MRDPRIHPAVGDLLRAPNGQKRRITEVVPTRGKIGAHVRFTKTVNAPHFAYKEQTAYIRRWKEWARDAAVLERGICEIKASR
jgi:hypothetical protein